MDYATTQCPVINVQSGTILVGVDKLTVLMNLHMVTSAGEAVMWTSKDDAIASLSDVFSAWQAISRGIFRYRRFVLATYVASLPSNANPLIRFPSDPQRFYSAFLFSQHSLLVIISHKNYTLEYPFLAKN